MNQYVDARESIESGGLVVYPTETVYGLGADALDSDSVERVYECKRRDRSKPVSLAVPNIQAANSYVDINGKEKSFMQEFLPGPVTVLLPKYDEVPDILTSGREKVGVRIPDNETALELLREVNPITSTSANVSGTGSVVDIDNLSDTVEDEVDHVIDEGVLEGGVGSTVVDLREEKVYREGAMYSSVDKWLNDN